MLSFLLHKHYVYYPSWLQLLLSLLIVLLLSSGVISNNEQDQTCSSSSSSNNSDDAGACFIDPPSDAKYATTSNDIEGGGSSTDEPYFPSNYFLPVPVRSIRQETHDTKIITFGLPESRTVGIPVSSAILMNVPPNKDNNESTTTTGKKPRPIMRPYNPINIEQKGSFDLIVKIYPDGIAGTYIDSLQVGDMVEFKQTKGNIKKQFQFPFTGVSKITMLAGGTGIAPMYQALVPILTQQNNQHDQQQQEVRLLVGNKTPDDILLKKELDVLAETYPDRFTVTYIVGDEEHDSRHAGGMYNVTGWIDSEKIQRLGFPSTEGENSGSSIVWVCGVDAMYNSLAGSRMKSLTEDSILYKLGYRDETVWRS